MSQRVASYHVLKTVKSLVYLVLWFFLMVVSENWIRKEREKERERVIHELREEIALISSYIGYIKVLSENLTQEAREAVMSELAPVLDEIKSACKFAQNPLVDFESNPLPDLDSITQDVEFESSWEEIMSQFWCLRRCRARLQEAAKKTEARGTRETTDRLVLELKLIKVQQATNSVLLRSIIQKMDSNASL